MESKSVAQASLELSYTEFSDTQAGTQPAANPFDTTATHTELRAEIAVRIVPLLWPSFWLGVMFPYIRKTLDSPGLPAGGVPGHPDVPHKELQGIGDIALWQRLSGWPWPPLSLSFGVSLPTGETVPNPFASEDSGHAVMQLGTGTVNPTLRADLALQHGPLHPFANATGTLVFYANEHGYQAGDQFLGRVGLAWPLLEARLRPRGALAVWWHGRDRHERLAEDTGGTSLFGELQCEAHIWSGLAAQAGLRLPIMQQVNSVQLVEDFQIFLGIRVATESVPW